MTTPIEQRRILRTAIPGPASAALHERKLASVSAGVSTGLPAYVVAGQGGILVDAGTFDWTAHPDRFGRLAGPDAAYHDVVWTDAAGPAAYITRARTVLLRNTGAAITPFNSWLFLQGLETLPLRARAQARSPDLLGHLARTKKLN